MGGFTAIIARGLPKSGSRREKRSRSYQANPADGFKAEGCALMQFAGRTLHWTFLHPNAGNLFHSPVGKQPSGGTRREMARG